MKTLASSIIQTIKEKGIPVQWQEFGMKLSLDAAISTKIVERIMKYRTSKDSRLVKEILKEYNKKIENLREAQKLLKENIHDYDANGIWKDLDVQIKMINIDEIISLLKKDFAIHPFPVVLESLKFNWNYMKENGVRSFYLMTANYLHEIEVITQKAKDKFEEEFRIGIVAPYWLLHSDLLSMEVPMHCDVCRITISVVIAARELLQANFLRLAARAGELVQV